MKANKILFFAIVTVAGIIIINWITFGPGTPPSAEQTTTHREVAPTVSDHSTPSDPIVAPPVESLPREGSNDLPAVELAQPIGSARRTEVAPVPAQTKKQKEPLHDPAARVAMSFVGIDPEAEAYWLEAIFDSSLPENEREDLMEDLNEEGLSDHKHPGPQDLPLILNRLTIIEQILPHADEFMVTHLGEAYKDLVNLAAITQGGGTPVR